MTMSNSKTLLLGCAVALVGIACRPASAATELEIEVYAGPTECDDADAVSDGNQLSMHYTGTIDESSATGTPGEKFDSSLDRGQTFDFAVGEGQVIKGWDQGLVGLCLGAKANLVIPPELGYGDAGAGGGVIPGGATLRFDVEVVAIDGRTAEPEFDAEAMSDEAAEEQMRMPEEDLFSEIDKDGDGKLNDTEVTAYFDEKWKGNIPHELWEKEDTDKDGFISWEEFTGPKGARPVTTDEL
mmetsp:Transcript_52277/g.111090  ORF Transcript_52277/g.111090 Transcript_52277/m.111090 type:complete len:241 (-) Transcript_52277:405-1127(-)